MCKWLHAPHLEIEKTIAGARMHYIWPGMTVQIMELISSCPICERFKRSIQKEEVQRLLQEEEVQDKIPKYPFGRF